MRTEITMNPLSGPVQRVEDDPPPVPEIVPLQTPEASPNYNATAGSTNMPQLPSTGPGNKTSFTTPSALPLCYIIAGNCICSGAICLCLWGFSTIENLTRWEKRTFNALSLLLSAALGFGIGFLYDRIGLFARGTLLQSRAHSVEEVCINVRSIH